MEISVVIPVYGCRAALPELYRRLEETLNRICDSWEIILVDDCCPLNSWEEIMKICSKDSRVTGIKLSRNFGQIRAITAGLDQSKGDWIVVMDCDLQDRPENIELLYNKAKEGYDVVFGRRMKRKDGVIKKAISKLFYKVYDYFTDGRFDSSICNFSIANRKVINAYCSMREQNRGYTLFIKWLGFEETAIDLESDERYEGKSSYNLKKRLRFAFELITSQSNKPLFFAIKFGFALSFVAFIYIVYLIIRYFIGGITVGWTTVVASIYLVGGLLMSTIGIVGTYIGNIFDETKRRPIYVINKCVNSHRED